MVVHNQPDAIDSPEARCPTQPQIGDVTASQRAVHVVEAMNEGQLAVRRDAQLTYLVGDEASMYCEELLPGSTFTVRPGVSMASGSLCTITCQSQQTSSMATLLRISHLELLEPVLNFMELEA